MRSQRALAFGILAGVLAIGFGGALTSFGQSKVPPGHPPVGGPGTSPTVPAPPPRGGAGQQELVWKLPRGWIEEPASSAMRRAQYRIPGGAGPGECVVFYFGPGQGGDAEANAARWAGQFRGADGRPASALKKTAITGGDIPVLLVEVTGTYIGGMGGTPSGPERPDYMLLGAIAQGPDANWFFRATGPRATIEPQRSAFDGMIRSISRGKPL